MPEKIHLKFGRNDNGLSQQNTAIWSRQSSKISPSIPPVSTLDKPNKKPRGLEKQAPPSAQPTVEPDQHQNKHRKQRKNGVIRANEPASVRTKFKIASKGTEQSTGSVQGVGRDISQVSNVTSSPQALRRIALTLEASRRNLPIWTKRENIRWALRNNDVLLINGETGSGKSTQVPQFLYTEPWCRRQKAILKTDDGSKEISVGGIIAVTQPRRVAALTLAHRVAREAGSVIMKGTPGVVGYAVRFDSISPPGMKIKFLTEGVLLQEMLHDPDLKRYSAVIVDEIHERSVDVDLIAGFLRKIVHGDLKGRGGVPLKVVVMSATLDIGGIETFFARPRSPSKDTSGESIKNNFSNSALEENYDTITASQSSNQSSSKSFSSWDGFSDGEEGELCIPSSRAVTKSHVDPNRTEKPHHPGHISSEPDHRRQDCSNTEGKLTQDGSGNGVAIEYVQGRQYGVEINYETTPSSDYIHTMLQTILRLHVTEPLPGDILAFLTGQDEIETLRAELETLAGNLVKTMPKMKVMPLYGSLPPQDQQAAFEKLDEPFSRKVVLATNIAETSVTVSGVRFVVDCGKSKVKQYRPQLGMESLLSKPISRVSAIQRAGRAGREAKGKCFRIYTEADFLQLDQDEAPEIMRCDVVEAVLKLKARGVRDVLTFPLMDSPGILPMERALIQLHTIGAIDDQAELTATGKRMASYPLPAAYSRVLIAAAEPEANVLLEAIDVISCLTTDSEVFLQPSSEEEKDRLSESRGDILAREGDILTLLATMRRYTSQKTNRNDWCRQRFISIRAMKMATQIRKQLQQLCQQQGLLHAAPHPQPPVFQPLDNLQATALIKSFLRAFVMKTALLGPDGNYCTTNGRNPIFIHPSSVLYGRKVEAIMFLEHVFTTKNYAKRVTAIESAWIEEAFL